jgi:hypothetical protein
MGMGLIISCHCFELLAAITNMYGILRTRLLHDAVLHSGPDIGSCISVNPPCGAILLECTSGMRGTCPKTLSAPMRGKD